MPAAPRSCLHTYGGQDGGRDLYRGLQHHPAGLERDYEQEFIAGHGHAQIGQLCADLRRTCHGAAAAHSGGSRAFRRRSSTRSVAGSPGCRAPAECPPAETAGRLHRSRACRQSCRGHAGTCRPAVRRLPSGPEATPDLMSAVGQMILPHQPCMQPCPGQGAMVAAARAEGKPGECGRMSRRPLAQRPARMTTPAAGGNWAAALGYRGGGGAAHVPLAPVRRRPDAALMPPSGVGWPRPRQGLGLFLGDLLQVRLPVLLVLLQGLADCRGLLLSHPRLSLGQPGLGLRGLLLGSCGPVLPRAPAVACSRPSR